MLDKLNVPPHVRAAKMVGAFTRGLLIGMGLFLFWLLTATALIPLVLVILLAVCWWVVADYEIGVRVNGRLKDRK